MKDCGGCLGPVVGDSPDLANLMYSLTLVSNSIASITSPPSFFLYPFLVALKSWFYKFDKSIIKASSKSTVFLATDGVGDNFNPHIANPTSGNECLCPLFTLSFINFLNVDASAAYFYNR